MAKPTALNGLTLVGVDISTPLTANAWYQVRLTYQYKDKAVVTQRLSKLVSGWNSAYRHRAYIGGAEVNGEYIVQYVLGVAVETVAQLGLDRYWAANQHVKGVHAYDLQQFMQPEQQQQQNPQQNQQQQQSGFSAPAGGAGAPPGVPGKVPWWLFAVLGLVVLGGGGYLYLRKRRGH